MYYTKLAILKYPPRYYFKVLYLPDRFNSVRRKVPVRSSSVLEGLKTYVTVRADMHYKAIQYEQTLKNWV